MKKDAFQILGGRKFVLSLIAMSALLILASMNPMAVTTEVVVGMLGIIATFSGSNSLVTAIMSRGSTTPPTVTPPPPPMMDIPAAGSAELPPIVSNQDIEKRVQDLEQAMNSCIDILKAQNETLNRLTLAGTPVNLSKRGQNNERQD